MKGNRILTLILGILMIGAGIYCVLTPELTVVSLSYVIGVTMIIDAIANIILWTDLKNAGYADGWSLAGAIISLICGIVLVGSLVMQLAVTNFMLYLAAAWLLALGIVRIVIAFKLKKAGEQYRSRFLAKRWWLVLIAGILLVLCGIFSFINPTALMIVIGINIGLAIILAGVALVSIAV